MCTKSLQLCLTVSSYRLQPARLLCPWDSPGKNTAVGCHDFLQGIFPTQGCNLCLLIEGRFFPAEPSGKPLCFSTSALCKPQHWRSTILSRLLEHQGCILFLKPNVLLNPKRVCKSLVLDPIDLHEMHSPGPMLWLRDLLTNLVAQMVKNLPAMQETRVRSLAWEDPLEKEMATHSSILVWKIPWTEEPGGSLGSHIPWAHKELDTTEQHGQILRPSCKWRLGDVFQPQGQRDREPAALRKKIECCHETEEEQVLGNRIMTGHIRQKILVGFALSYYSIRCSQPTFVFSSCLGIVGAQAV